MISTSILAVLMVVCIFGGLHFGKKAKEVTPGPYPGSLSPTASAGLLFTLAILFALMLVFNLYQIFVLKVPGESLEKIFL